MKTAILTFSSAQNYGAQLQAFGLQYALQKIGMDAYHIRIREDKHSNSIKFFIKYMLSKKKRNSYDRFQRENLKFYNGVYDISNISDINKSFDVFISGSDQVFNMKNGVDPIYFQEFVENDHLKISYAASMGIGNVPVQYQEMVATDLNGFAALSVREQNAVTELGKLTKTSIVRNIDPVFLPKMEDWEKICIPPKYKEPYIFVYGTEMTDEIVKIALEISKKTGYKIFSIFPMKGADSLFLKIGPAEFIGYIRNASYVVTTSFHCTAFSMIYEKNLIEVLHSTTGSRAKGLLELLNKTECIYDGENFDLLQKVNYHHTRQIIERERTSGYEFLSAHLK